MMEENKNLDQNDELDDDQVENANPNLSPI